jgi:hypothetical protein
MQGNEFIWIASVIIGITVIAWLVLDWLESAQNWQAPELDPKLTLGRSEYPTPDALEVETELMLSYPLDPFAPALMWRPQPQDQWIEAQTETVNMETVNMERMNTEMENR